MRYGSQSICTIRIREQYDALCSSNVSTEGEWCDECQPCLPADCHVLHYRLGCNNVSHHHSLNVAMKNKLTLYNSAIAAAGGGLNFVQPKERAFSLLDLTISYPFIPESISTSTLALVCLLAPAIIIALIVAIFVPGRNHNRKLQRKEVIALKLWEWEKGWAGLALSLAAALFATQALKNMFGKPRPNCIATCDPDLSNIDNYVVGGLGQGISPRWVLVSSSICANPNVADIRDGFRSFPSGHASFSWAGLLYFSLYLCSKFNISIPYLPYQPSPQSTNGNQSSNMELLPLHHQRGETPSDDTTKSDDPSIPQNPTTFASQPLRNRAASPPLYLLVLAFIPIAVALYICSTRYAEYYHKGFDIIAGSFIGIVTAWISFRLYHLPFGRGEGWAWGPRSRDRAFGISVGTDGFVGSEGWRTARREGMGTGAQAA